MQIALERRNTEIRVTGYHEVIVGEAGLKVTHKLEYLVEFAATDKLQFSAPKELDDKLHLQPFPSLKEKKRIGDTKDGRSLWELTLQDKLLGPLTIQVDHEQDLKALEPEKPQELLIPNIHAENCKPQQGYIAVCKESLLELEPSTTNLETRTAQELPTPLRPPNVYLAFQYFQPDYTLRLKLTRHLALTLSSTIVDLMQTTLVVSEEKKLTARAVLYVENARGEQYLELGLPKGASIRAVAVNQVLTSPLQSKDRGTLIKLPTPGAPFPVEIVYSAPLENPGRLGWTGTLKLESLEVLANVPVNKIELDLYVPEEYVYFGFGGTLHPVHPPDRLSRTLAWLNTAVQGRTPPAAQTGGYNFAAVHPVQGTFPTDGHLFRFQTLAPRGIVELTYYDRKLFWLIDILVFLGAIGLSWFLIARRKYSALSVCLAFLIVPLCAGWFLSPAAAEPFDWWFMAGELIAAFCVLLWAWRGWFAWRQTRIALAPDPYLEQAGDQPAGPAGAPPPLPTEPPSPGQPPAPPAADESGESLDDNK